MNEKVTNSFKPLLLLSLSWLIVQLGLLFHFGIRADFEATKYINEAHIFLETGNFSSNNFWFYSLEIFLIIFSLKAKLGFGFVVFTQLIINYLGTMLFYRAISDFSSKRIAMIATVLLIICIPFQQYNVALQTESIFHSLLLILTVVIISKNIKLPKKIWSVTGLLLLLIITRPSGILFVPPTILFFVSALNWKKNPLIKICSTVILLVGGIFILDTILGSGGELDFMLPFKENMIICGVARESSTLNLSTNPNSISGIIYYIAHNPVHFLQLAYKKTVAFFGIYRNYFSMAHNLLLMTFFFVLYFLSGRTLIQWNTQHKSTLVFCLSAIIVVWLSVILTCDDWHNRFLVTLLPFLLILSSMSFSKQNTNTGSI